jgi:transcriptional antiterminator RfaH
MYWHAINTKCHSEQIAELKLKQLGIETFTPQIKQRKRIRRKDQTVVGPLFPSYLFARFDLMKHYRAVTYATGVKNIVSFGALPAIVDDQIVESLRSKLVDGYIVLSPPSFRHGQLVRIQEGPLQGFEALFDHEMTGQQRAVLLLRTIAYQGRVVVPMGQVVNG